MKFNFLQKQTSRREMLRGSATLAGSAFLAHSFSREVAPRFRGGLRSHHQPGFGSLVCQAGQQPHGRSGRRESLSLRLASKVSCRCD
jgi:hypothetical protein